jgi:hypothetical protein
MFEDGDVVRLKCSDLSATAQLTSAGQTFVFPYALHDKRIIEGARGCGGGGITVGVGAQIGALPLPSPPPERLGTAIALTPSSIFIDLLRFSDSVRHESR